MRRLDESGVTEIIALVLTVMMVTTLIAATLLWALPLFQDRQVMSRVDSVTSQFITVKEILHELLTQGVNSSSLVSVASDTGTFTVSRFEGTRFVVYYPLDFKTAFNVTGLDPQESSYDKQTFKIIRTQGGDSTIDIQGYQYPSGKRLGNLSDIAWDGGGPWEHTISPGYDLEGAVRIDVNYSGTPFPFGRIWIFDVGQLSYKSSSSGVSRSVLFEMMAVIRGSTPTQGYIQSGPMIYNTTDDFVFQMVQLQPYEIGSISASKDLSLEITMQYNASMVVENRQSAPHYVTTQIHGSYKEAWKTYFISEFGLPFNSDTTMVLNEAKEVTLSHSRIVMDMRILV